MSVMHGGYYFLHVQDIRHKRRVQYELANLKAKTKANRVQTCGVLQVWKGPLLQSLNKIEDLMRL